MNIVFISPGETPHIWHNLETGTYTLLVHKAQADKQISRAMEEIQRREGLAQAAGGGG